ncbi:MAG: topoisomerase DNA-binding C4 zinc finger domain-containing protein, partial [Candidatus Margulisbacteria bacterium]|nr:topoisomerase DNA-binding C4 zinc finger domain-containing protein [Candidatus Margulisiibacteriota bacterium]
LGLTVNNQLLKHFPEIVDIGFTANVEDELDKIIEGNTKWTEVLKAFYFPFEETVKKAEVEMENIKEPEQITDEKCEKCGKPMAIKVGRFGPFMACTGFPACRNTKAIKKIVEGVKCPLCGGEIVEKMTRRRRLFFGCANYPNCNFGSWDKPLVGENCPKCGAFMVEKKQKDQEPKKLCIICDIKEKEKAKSPPSAKATAGRQKSKVKKQKEKSKE